LQRAPLDHPLKSNESANSVDNIAERKVNTNLNGRQATPTGQPNNTSAVKYPYATYLSGNLKKIVSYIEPRRITKPARFFTRPADLSADKCGMRRTVVLDVVGLSPAMVGEHTPLIAKWRDSGARVLPIGPVLPAVTTTVQTTYRALFTFYPFVSASHRRVPSCN
jgi:hypothetical protein